MRSALLAAVASLALGAGTAHATFVNDPNCDNMGCVGGVKFFNDTANKDVTTFHGTVGGHVGAGVQVTTVGPIDTGAGFSTITPVKGGTLTSLTFVPDATNTETFSDFSFRGQLAAGDTLPATIDVVWAGALGDSGTVPFTFDKVDEDFGAFGIVSNDGDVLTSVMVDVSAPGLKEFKQVEFSFGTSIPAPEPISIAVFGIGLAGIGLAKVSYSRRRPRH